MLINSITARTNTMTSQANRRINSENRQVSFQGKKQEKPIKNFSWKNKALAAAMAMNSIVPNPAILGTAIATGIGAASCETYDLEIFGPIEKKHYESFDDFLEKNNLQNANKENIDQAIVNLGTLNGIEIGGVEYKLITVKDTSLNLVDKDLWIYPFIVLGSTEKAVDEDGNPMKIVTRTKDNQCIVIANGFNSIDVNYGNKNIVIANDIKSKITLGDENDELHYTAGASEETSKPVIRLGNGINRAYINHADIRRISGGNDQDYVSMYDGDVDWIDLRGGNDTLKLGGYADVGWVDMGSGENTLLIPEDGRYNIDELTGENIKKIIE